MSEPKRPPGPTKEAEKARPLKDRLSDVKLSRLQLVRGHFDRYGDPFYFRAAITGHPTYSTCHPDLIHEAMVTRGSSFDKRSEDINAFLGEGLIASNGALWRKQRRIVQPAFRSKRMPGYAAVMVEKTQEMLDRWQDGDVRDIGHEMMELTLRVVAKTLFNYDVTEEMDDAIAKVARAMAGFQATAGFLDLFPQWLPTPLHVKRKRSVKDIDDFVYPIIDAAEPSEDATDFLGYLKYQHVQGEMTRKLLRDELVNMFLAGHETTALAMTWAFYLLSSSLEDEADLHKELDRVLGKAPPRHDQYDDLIFAQMVFKESLRLFPPIYHSPRVANEDTMLGEWEIPKGSHVLLWTYFCHLDERWYPNPKRFIPARWFPELNMVKHPNAYIPFAAGMRQCIGIHFAMMEGTLLLASIAQRYKIRRADDDPVQLNPRVTLAPLKPIMMRLEKRY